jgi:hypothetical protein
MFTASAIETLLSGIETGCTDCSPSLSSPGLASAGVSATAIAGGSSGVARSGVASRTSGLCTFGRAVERFDLACRTGSACDGAGFSTGSAAAASEGSATAGVACADAEETTAGAVNSRWPVSVLSSRAAAAVAAAIPHRACVR